MLICPLENWKIHKFVEIKQHTLTQPMSQGRNHKEFRNYLETNGGLGKSLGEGEQHPTPVFLAWRIAWTEKPGGYSPWDHKESDTTEQLTFKT